ncbi:MAG: S8 family serine peptidase [Actinomycetota bacterium]|nr:S8 family serine peptidase [Actinomycetota bacterium]
MDVRFRRCAARIVLVGLVVAAAAPLTTPTAALATPSGLDPGLPTRGSAMVPVVVAGVTATAAVDDAVRQAGGTVTAPLPVVDGVAATVPASRLADLAAAPGVRAVTADRAASFADNTFDPETVASPFVRSTTASSAWSTGNYGAGIGVAVLDTGVSPMPDLAGRLVHGPDFSGEGTVVDTFGHGTVMASLVAGNGADSAAREGGAIAGVAPAAHIVAVKVAGANGATDVSTILEAMHWIATYRDQFNIRVVNLAWGVPSTQSVALDPLNYAVERLWDLGIVVVVAAGNSGPQFGTVTKPGDDPVVLTVGAYNDRGDASPGNDNIPQWTSRGPTQEGVAKPDVVAPGRTILAGRSYGSAVEHANPKALVMPSYIRGSGTSQASAVTSGVVALLLAARPELTPDQVKAAIKSTAHRMPNANPNAQGVGRVDLAAALIAQPTNEVQPRPATGLGSIEASRGGGHVVADCNGVATDIVGEIDVRCEAWDPQMWTTSQWTGDDWTGVSWKDVDWSNATWDGVSWKDGTWTGVSWKDTNWTGVSWKEWNWTNGRWVAFEYEGDFLTAFWGKKPAPGNKIRGEVYTPPPELPAPEAAVPDAEAQP